MTVEELDAAIAETIIPQEKPRSTQNSHRRKQWENRRHWRICTVGQSCKIGGQKDYDECYALYEACNYRGAWLLYLTCCWGGLGRISYNNERHHFVRYSYNVKGLRREAERKLRRYKGEIVNGSMYKRIFDYQWSCI